MRRGTSRQELLHHRRADCGLRPARQLRGGHAAAGRDPRAQHRRSGDHASLKPRYFGAFTVHSLVGMFRRVAAGNGHIVVLEQRLNDPARRRGRDTMKILTGNSNKPLAEAISAKLALPLVKANIRRFADNEIFVEILENVRGEDMFVLQSTSFTANDHLMELLITIDALRRSSARRITAVLPYYGYARQDRRTGPRTPISAKLVANLLTHAGANRVLTLDLHASQIQGFFDIPVDNLFAGPVMSNDIKDTMKGRNITIVSPDVGGVVRARALAKRINADLAIIDKRREAAGVSEVMNVIGDVKDRDCVLIDDIVDSGGTLCNAAVALMDQGAKSVCAYITHGVLSGGAVARIAASPMEKLVITDSIQPTEAVRVSPNIKPLSIATLMAEAVKRISEETSVSSLFD